LVFQSKLSFVLFRNFGTLIVFIILEAVEIPSDAGYDFVCVVNVTVEAPLVEFVFFFTVVIAGLELPSQTQIVTVFETFSHNDFSLVFFGIAPVVLIVPSFEVTIF
jgi:hypothetical protein